MSENSVTLVGHLCADPAVRVLPSGKTVTTLRLATNRTWKGADGTKKNQATFHRVVCWNKTAESCGKFLKKGRQIMVNGRIDNRSYQDTDGKMHYISEVVASHVDFLSGSGSKVTNPQTDKPIERLFPEDAFPL